MEAITYLKSFDMSTRNGQKLAKISQLKLKTLAGKYRTASKELDALVNNNVASNVVTTPVTSVAPITEAPVVNPQPVPVAPVLESVAKDNYNEVVDKFSMKIYGKTLKLKPLVGAKKLRVAQKVRTHTKGLSSRLGIEPVPDNDLDSLNVSVTNNIPLESNVVEMPKVQPEVQMQTQPTTNYATANNVSELKKVTNTLVSDNLNRDIASPSVDDYLQKDRPVNDNGLIIQLNSDVQSLKEKTVESKALLQQLEDKYNSLKDQRERRIKELEEEKLSYTATLEGLTERIRSLQNAIAQEEQSLSGYKKAA